MAVLKLIKGGTVGQILPLTGERVVLGRHPTCQIVLDNAAVSRHHAQILESHGTFFLEDLRSRNGTQLNEESIRGRMELRDGDHIKLCDYVFQFLSSSDSSTALKPKAYLGGSSRLRETAEGNLVGLLDDDEVAAGEQIEESSSIISRIEADGLPGVRLHVRPEVKLKAVLEISQHLGRALQVEAVLPLILDGLFKIFPQAQYGFVLLKDHGTGRVSVRASKSRLGDDDDRVPLSLTIVEQAMRDGQAVLSADATRDKRFAKSESLMEMQIRSVMCCPLLDLSSKALGVIQISTRDLQQPFNQDDLDLLASVSSQCARALETATLHEAALAKQQVEQELEFATHVQLGFLPNEAPQLPGYEFDDYYEPAHRIGGDYFDYIRLPNGNLALAVGDVAGKGVPAALLMARLHASARYHLLSAVSPADAMSSLNSEIATSGLGFRFITLVFAVIDPRRGEVHLVNAGHLPPMLRKRDGTVIDLGHKDSGMPLGVMPQQQYHDHVLPIEPGETLLFFTDGLTEAMDSHQQVLGRSRLQQMFAASPEPVRELIVALMDQVEAYIDDHQQRDDMCVVAARRVE